VAGWLNSIVDSLDAVIRQTPTQPVCLAHGDLTPSQLVLAGPRIGVLDFDGLCQAEPAFDLGRFLAYLRVALAKSGNVAGDALASRFLERYHVAGGPPTPSARVQVYEIASLVRMAAHSWQQLKPARLRLACGVIQRQTEALLLPLIPGSHN
jgi:aminoglycoside phosphotransferase (APT) family kinase protein